MSATEPFFDSNMLLYVISADARKADIAEGLLVKGGLISVQVLNEFALAARRKHVLEWPEIRMALSRIRQTCAVEPLTEDTHDLAVHVAERYGYRIYDSCILAAALLAGCTTVFSEDMQDGQVIEDTLTIRNPFA
jgi:predicted nucleic acid-binding protein